MLLKQYETDLTYESTDGSNAQFTAKLATGWATVPASVCSASDGWSCSPTPDSTWYWNEGRTSIVFTGK